MKYSLPISNENQYDILNKKFPNQGNEDKIKYSQKK